MHVPVDQPVVSPEQLHLLEARANVFHVYAWLAKRYPLHMPDAVKCEELRQELVRRIEAGLEALSVQIAKQRRWRMQQMKYRE